MHIGRKNHGIKKIGRIAKGHPAGSLLSILSIFSRFATLFPATPFLGVCPLGSSGPRRSRSTRLTRRLLAFVPRCSYSASTAAIGLKRHAICCNARSSWTQEAVRVSMTWRCSPRNAPVAPKCHPRPRATPGDRFRSGGPNTPGPKDGSGCFHLVIAGSRRSTKTHDRHEGDLPVVPEDRGSAEARFHDPLFPKGISSLLGAQNVFVAGDESDPACTFELPKKEAVEL